MQPCSQPRYGLIDRSKPMSGDVLRLMIVFGFSTVTVVRSGGGPSSSASRASSQSPSASLSGRLKRVGVRFSGAPRPERASGRFIPWIYAVNKNVSRTKIGERPCRLSAGLFLDRPAGVGRLLEAAEIVDVGIAHVLQRLSRQRRSPARRAIKADR